MFFRFKIGFHTTCHYNVTNDKSKGKIYHSRGKLNSFGRLVAFYGDKKINVKKRLPDRNGHLLILDTEIDGSEYILV